MWSTNVTSSRAADGNPKRLRAVYYRAPDGREPVSDFIDALPVKQQVVLDNQIDRINELCKTDNFVILLHALSKTTAKIPAADIKIANARFADFKQRMEALPRKRPRAIGGDAP